MVVSPDGRLIASAGGVESRDGTVKLWDVQNRRQVRTLTGHSGSVLTLVFSADSRLLSSGAEDDTIRVWDVASGRELMRFYVPRAGVREIFFSADGRYLVSVPYDGGGVGRDREPNPELEKCLHIRGKPGFCESHGVSVWDLRSGRFLHAVTETYNWRTEPASSRWGVAVSPDAALLAESVGGNRIALYDLPTGRSRPPFAGVPPFVFDHRGQHLGFRTADGAVAVWDVRSGQRTSTIQTAGVPVMFVADGRQLITLEERAGEAITTVWEVATAAAVRRLTLGKKYNCANCLVQVSPDGASVVRSGFGEPKVAVWSLDNPQQEPRLWRGLSAPVAFSPVSGQIFAAFGHSIWSLDPTNVAESCFSVMSPGRVAAVAIAASPVNGQTAWFATSSGGAVALWDGQSGVQLKISPKLVEELPTIGYLANGVERNPLIVTWVPGIVTEGTRFDDWPTWDEPRCASAAHDAREVGRGEIWNASHAHWVSFGSALPVAFSQAANWFAENVFESPSIRIWNWETRKRVKLLDDSTDEYDNSMVTALAANGSGDELASSMTRAHGIRLWDMTTYRRKAVLSGHTEKVTGLAYGTDGLLASTGWDHTVRLWNTAAADNQRALISWHIDEAPATLAFRPDAQLLAVAAGDAVIEFDLQGHEKRRFAGHAAGVAALAFSKDGSLLLTGSDDGTTRLWNERTGVLLATLVSFRESADWLVVTPDGLFDGSRAAWQLILWRFNNNTFDTTPVETFFRDFFRPGLLAEIIAGKRPKATTAIADVDRRLPCARLSLVGRATPGGSGPTRQRATIAVDVQQAQADGKHSGSGVRDVRLFRNGSLVRMWRGAIPLDALGHATLSAENVMLVAGENRFVAYAYSNANTKSADVTLVVAGPRAAAPKGKVWILAVGIDHYDNPGYRLKSAVNDAEAFAHDVEAAQRALGRYDPIVVPIKNHFATKANLLLALDRLAGRPAALPDDAPPELEKLQPAQPEDAVLIFFSGHGTGDQAGARFYLIPHDMGYTGTESELNEEGARMLFEHSVSDQELTAALEGIDAGSIGLVIDACRSGQILNADDSRQGPMNSQGLAQLAYDKGMYILTASRHDQEAFETRGNSTFNHGLLTEALLEGLRPEPNDIHASEITLRSWLEDAAGKVPQLYRKVKAESNQPVVEEQVQAPRLFYPREAEGAPFVVAKPEQRQR